MVYHLEAGEVSGCKLRVASREDHTVVDASADLRVVWLRSEVRIVAAVVELGDPGHIEFVEDVGVLWNRRVASLVNLACSGGGCRVRGLGRSYGVGNLWSPLFPVFSLRLLHHQGLLSHEQ